MPERFSSIIDAHVVLRRNGKILLMRRAGDVFASGQFCMPSGHLEQGESILCAAIRETKEEVGVVLEPAALRLVLSIHQRNPDKKHTRIGFVFEPDYWDGEPSLCEPTKCTELLWADPLDLPVETAEYTVAVLRAIVRHDSFALNGW
jgi:8-oxo-dGTP diphosphatase